MNKAVGTLIFSTIIIIFLSFPFKIHSSHLQVINETKIKATDSTDGDLFGNAVSISGDYVFVGAYGKMVQGNQEAGVAYIFQRQKPGEWHQIKQLEDETPSDFEYFGSVLAVYEDYAIIGCNKDDISQIEEAGSAIIYHMNGTDWVIHRKIVAKNPTAHEWFGGDVAIFGDLALVGTYNGALGSAYILERNESSVWEEKVQLTKGTIEFGFGVAISNDYAFIGDKRYSNEAGACYVFKRENDDWNYKQTITPNDPHDIDWFCFSVAIYGEFAIVGARFSNNSVGSAYIFHKNGEKWEEVQKLTPFEGLSEDYFGHDVAINEEIAVVGARGGYVYLYLFNGTEWVFQEKITGSDIGDDSQFGESVSIWEKTFIVGARKDESSGTAFIFELGYLCDDGYKGNEPHDCLEYSCEKLNNCSNRGECVGPNICDCEKDWYANCSIHYCNNHGHTIEDHTCMCFDGWNGNANCSVFECNSLNNCNGHGQCYANNSCICYDGWTNRSDCSEFECSSLNDCNENGECKGPNECECNDGYFGDECAFTCCNGVASSNESVCNSHGSCIDFNVCECKKGYTPESFCESFTCFGILSDNETVCSSHGNCVGVDNCTCYDLYIGDRCDFWNCYSISNHFENVCGGHGKCIAHDTCLCDDLYGQTIDCKGWKCNNHSHFSGESCSGNGICIDFDTCHCIEGYGGEECQFWNCFNTSHDSTETCSGNGICYKPDTCICNDRYEGKNCDSFKCGNKFPNESDVCYGNGDCVSPSKCSCDYGYQGELCETNTALVVSIISSISFFGLIFFVTGILLSLFIAFLVVKYQKQNKRLNRFEEIDGIDILADEHELEKKTGISFKVNKNLFKVDYEKIKIKKRIGKGGGSASIFLCEYEGRNLVFKLFSMSCFGSQNNFIEFEKEVQIISSVSHENILRFYGASVKPPKVGYLMQYCEFGDVKNFLGLRYKNMTGKEYPLFGRIKMLQQIASAMSHLHSLSIIHRDLKSENVLVDSSFKCQVMDFGLSKIYSDKTMTRAIGTSQYMAPELISSGRYDEKIDVFSFSIMIFEIMTGNFKPYEGGLYGLSGIESKVAKDENFRPDFSIYKNIPEFVITLAKKGWSHNPLKRPNFEEIKKIIESEAKTEKKIYLKKENEKIEQVTLKEPSMECLENTIQQTFFSKEEILSGFNIFDEKGTQVNEDNIFNMIKDEIVFSVYLKGKSDLLQKKDKINSENLKVIAEKDRLLKEKDLVISEYKRVIAEQELEIKNLKDKM